MYIFNIDSRINSTELILITFLSFLSKTNIWPTKKVRFQIRHEVCKILNFTYNVYLIVFPLFC